MPSSNQLHGWKIHHLVHGFAYQKSIDIGDVQLLCLITPSDFLKGDTWATPLLSSLGDVRSGCWKI